MDTGSRLGLRIVAEGVEDRNTLGILEEFGCNTIQGYYFSRPLPASDLSHWLRDQPPVADRVRASKIRAIR